MRRTPEEILALEPADLLEPNANDIRALVYVWFTLFEHGAETDRFLERLDERGLEIRFPDVTITDHAGFRRWHEDIMSRLRWAFHEIHALEVAGDAGSGFHVTFVVDWYGELTDVGSDPDTAPRAREEALVAHRLRQDWNVHVRDGVPVITRSVVTPIEG